jgi:hypothetical protein
MRTVTITDRRTFPDHIGVECAVYRTIAMIDVVAHPGQEVVDRCGAAGV